MTKLAPPETLAAVARGLACTPAAVVGVVAAAAFVVVAVVVVVG